MLCLSGFELYSRWVPLNIGGLPPASIRIFGHVFYLALFIPLPRNFWLLESRARIF